MPTTRAGRRRGSTLVELAVVLPVFLLLLFGTFFIGSIYSHQAALNNAAREAARLGVVGRPDSDLISRVQQLTSEMSHDPTRFAVVIDRSNNIVRVSVSYVEKSNIPIIGKLFNNMRLIGRAEHRFETSWVDS